MLCLSLIIVTGTSTASVSYLYISLYRSQCYLTHCSDDWEPRLAGLRFSEPDAR